MRTANFERSARPRFDTKQITKRLAAAGLGCSEFDHLQNDGQDLLLN